jgi:hypothetical protein
MDGPNTLDFCFDFCEIQLNLPYFFETSAIRNIRKMINLIVFDCGCNTAMENLSNFFEAWQKDIEWFTLECEESYKRADSEFNAQERLIACFGTMADPGMKQKLTNLKIKRNDTRRWLKQALGDKAKYDKITQSYALAALGYRKI